MTRLHASTSLRRPRPLRRDRPGPGRPSGLAWLVAAEAAAGGLGFLGLVHQARRLGPGPFARVESAAAVAAWLLVLVRGGFDVIVYREAARRPRLVGPLTDLLLGLRLAAAAVGLLVVLLLAAGSGAGQGGPLALAGLTLLASAFAADVGPRARGELGWVAFAQTARAFGFVSSTFLLVRGPGDVLPAAGCLALGEGVGALVFLARHAAEFGAPRPRFRRRAGLVLARRGLVAGLTRFGRVTLYGADLLLLGYGLGGATGEYAAARRVVYALLALGIVVPSALGPGIGRAWAAGPDEARRAIGRAIGLLWSASLPAAVGLGLTADRWMPALFGPDYRDGGAWLALVAARLPWTLAAAFAQAALVACRREGGSLRLVAAQLAFGAVAMPVGLWVSGVTGVGRAAIGVELFGAVYGWVLLARLGVATPWAEQVGRPLVGCLGLFAGWRFAASAPLVVVVAASGLGYLAAWRLAGRFGGRPR